MKEWERKKETRGRKHRGGGLKRERRGVARKRREQEK